MRITIIEDNIPLAEAIADQLKDDGHVLTLLDTGEGAVEFINDNTSDLIILDINLPHLSGLEILKQVRDSKNMIPVLLLSARDLITDKVEGLNIGADDYLVKPFDMKELKARIGVLLRRQSQKLISYEKIGDINYDFGSRELSINGEILELRRRELMLFECLIKHRHQLVSKATIAEYIFGFDSDADEKSIETHVSRLRKKISPHGVTIKVARGLGYMLKEAPPC